MTYPTYVWPETQTRVGPETTVKAKAAAEIIRGLQHTRPDHTMIGLRGKGAEAIAFMRSDDLLEILDAAALQARAPEGVPEGYVLAPIEPTEDMHDAARDWSQKKYGKPIGIEASAGCWGAMLSAAPQAPAPAAPFQDRVKPWMDACFGPEISADRIERNHRFLEEALELVQAIGCTQFEAHQLVDYVFGRPAGDPRQEAGGVMVTLAALCLANGLDMAAAGETELARVWTKVEAIRAKQAAKPKHGPLPGPSDAAPAPQGDGWREIAEAPKNKPVDVWVIPYDAFANGNPGRIPDARFIDGEWKRFLDGRWSSISYCVGTPTHFRLPPAPPAERANHGGKNAE